jgi:cytochrome c
MPIRREVIAILAGAVVAAAGCKGDKSPGGNSDDGGGTAPGELAEVKAGDRIPAGGVIPAANALSKPRPDKLNPEAGGALFASMNCDGCHGGGAIGWVGPSLVDGRWRYGGTDEEIFTSIFYGRPKGMPAYGGVIGTDGAWMLVSYIKSQSPPPQVPTTSWLPGGNASANPAPQAGPQAEEKASPSGTEQEKASDSGAQGGGQAGEPAKTASVSPDEMPAKYGCTACHAVDHKVVGPAFKDVAAKYKGQDVEAQLAQKVHNGGAGVWGQVPMPPNPQVPDEDLHALVKWVLSRK